MNELVTFKLPASFILARALPTGAELAYGYRHGWVTQADVVAIVKAKCQAGEPLREPEEELMDVLPIETDRFDQVIAELEISPEPTERRARLWLFLVLSALLENQSSFEDPLGIIELLYADFDYPEEIQGFVRFMPEPSGQPPIGVEGIKARWREYVGRVGAEYSHRSGPPP
jgi:hypothetical protein